MWHAWDRTEKCTKFWWESLKERDHSEDRGVNERIVLEWILGRLAEGWSAYNCLRTGTGGRLL
jgi:hypothetical protein